MYTQGIILGSFYYGYIVTQVPGGVLSEKFGAKIVLTVGMMVCGVTSLLIPVMARLHFGALIAVRAVQGMGQVSIYSEPLCCWWLHGLSQQGIWVSFWTPKP